eukprot:COSAG02_NODE_5104_length_4627_cov_3.621466_7_plen_72_part_00
MYTVEDRVAPVSARVCVRASRSSSLLEGAEILLVLPAQPEPQSTAAVSASLSAWPCTVALRSDSAATSASS